MMRQPRLLLLRENHGLCPWFQRGFTYAEKTRDHSSNDRCVEIEVTKEKNKNQIARGSKSHKRLYPTANFIGSRAQDAVVINIREP